jgi:hypothetical protein
MTPTGGVCLAVREREEGKERGGPPGKESDAAGPAGPLGERKKKRPVGLGLAGGKGERKKIRESGPGQNRKRERKTNACQNRKRERKTNAFKCI